MGSVAVPQISIPRNSRFGVLDRVHVRNREGVLCLSSLKDLKGTGHLLSKGRWESEPEFDLVNLVELIYATIGR